jgi:hypothetical protein
MRRVGFAWKLAMAVIAIAPLLLRAQTLPAQKPAFDVASIKRNTTNGPTDFRPRRSGDLVMMHNTQPFSIISMLITSSRLTRSMDMRLSRMGGTGMTLTHERRKGRPMIRCAS